MMIPFEERAIAHSKWTRDDIKEKTIQGSILRVESRPKGATKGVQLMASSNQ